MQSKIRTNVKRTEFIRRESSKVGSLSIPSAGFGALAQERVDTKSCDAYRHYDGYQPVAPRLKFVLIN
jgi:hypothetical protein